MRNRRNYPANTSKRPDLILTAAAFCCVLFLAGPARCHAAVFAIESTQSQISLTGTVEGLALSPQGTGSLTASYQGDINATLSGSTLQFTGGSTIAAVVSGNWEPKSGGAPGTAPADYGGEISVPFLGMGYGATRNLVLDLTSPALTLTGGSFNSSQITLLLVTNTDPVLDYNSPLGTGSEALSGSALNTGLASSISTNGSIRQLQIHIDTTLTEPDNTKLTLTGLVVATNAIVLSPPKIFAFATMGGNLVLTVTNATTGSRLSDSTNLVTWNPASATVSTNGGFLIFTIPMSQPGEFFRVQQ
ncbi:MAG: hypothetical protein ACREE6_17065 [Limisphaerales bacterium]